MSILALGAFGVLLVYLGLRVVQLKRSSMPFLVAYPLFVVTLVGGSFGVFIAASNAAVVMRLGHELGVAFTYGMTIFAVIVFWRVARRLIG